ncbi:neutral protease I, partial [Paxillus ammoniavirescens]
DPVIANAQDGSGFNNVNFMRPPDRQNGRCRMYLWNTASPYPDRDMGAGIVIHKLVHGLSPHLMGGSKNSGCLGWDGSGGMGEGWGDFIVTSVRSTSAYSDYAMGTWTSHREGGIHNYIYSLNTTVNPSTYKTLHKPGYWGVHAIREVWAEMLWTFNLLTGQANHLIPKHGNMLLMQLVLDRIKLQSCSPGFFDVRDVIVQADKILTWGENACTLWEGFAERGLGVNATVVGSTPWGRGVRQDVSHHPFLSC